MRPGFIGQVTDVYILYTKYLFNLLLHVYGVRHLRTVRPAGGEDGHTATYLIVNKMYFFKYPFGKIPTNKKKSRMTVPTNRNTTEHNPPIRALLNKHMIKKTAG